MSQNFDHNQNYYFFNKKNSIPIVFIHGVGLNHKIWEPQINFFENSPGRLKKYIELLTL